MLRLQTGTSPPACFVFHPAAASEPRLLAGCSIPPVRDNAFIHNAHGITKEASSIDIISRFLGPPLQENTEDRNELDRVLKRLNYALFYSDCQLENQAIHSSFFQDFMRLLHFAIDQKHGLQANSPAKLLVFLRHKLMPVGDDGVQV